MLCRQQSIAREGWEGGQWAGTPQTRHVGTTNHWAIGVTGKLWTLLVWWQPQPDNREPVTVWVARGVSSLGLGPPGRAWAGGTELHKEPWLHPLAKGRFFSRSPRGFPCGWHAGLIYWSEGGHRLEWGSDCGKLGQGVGRGTHFHPWTQQIPLDRPMTQDLAPGWEGTHFLWRSALSTTTPGSRRYSQLHSTDRKLRFTKVKAGAQDLR